MLAAQQIGSGNGGGEGIGRVTARLFAREGARLVIKTYAEKVPRLCAIVSYRKSPKLRSKRSSTKYRYSRCGGHE